MVRRSRLAYESWPSPVQHVLVNEPVGPEAPPAVFSGGAGEWEEECSPVYLKLNCFVRFYESLTLTRGGCGMRRRAKPAGACEKNRNIINMTRGNYRYMFLSPGQNENAGEIPSHVCALRE